MRWLLFALPVLVFAGLAAFFYKGLFLDPSEVPNALAGKPRPDFTLPALYEDAPALTAADLDGELVVLNFFASWCVPCRAEHPLLQQIADSGLAKVYGVNYKDKPEDAQAWLDELGNPYVTVGADRNGRVGIDYGLYGVPETYIINRDGLIAYKEIGPITPKNLNDKILPILKKLSQ